MNAGPNTQNLVLAVFPWPWDVLLNQARRDSMELLDLMEYEDLRRLVELIIGLDDIIRETGEPQAVPFDREAALFVSREPGEGFTATVASLDLYIDFKRGVGQGV